MVNKTQKRTSYNYIVIDISEEDEVGYKAVISKFPKLHIVADSPEELHKAVAYGIEEEIKFYKKKGMRIPKPDAHKYSGQFILRVRPEIHETLVELAKSEGSSLNQYLNKIIEDQIT